MEILASKIYDDKKDMNIFNEFILPHIRYISASANYNPPRQYYRYSGTADNLTNGELYEFSMMAYSPDRETDRIDVLVTIDNNRKIVQFNDNIKDWSKL